MRLAQLITRLTLVGAPAGAYALPRMSRALRTGLQRFEVTERPPLEDDALPHEAAARVGAPKAKTRQQASRPDRPIARLRVNDFRA
jgi:hypothetical protein